MKIIRVFRKPRPPEKPTHLAGFDEVYYRYWYRDVERYDEGPLAHYLAVGWKEGRDPSAGFSTDGYLAAHADVRENGANPLVHFLHFGLAEGRKGWEKELGIPAPRPRVLTNGEPQKRLPPPA